jgi:peptide/nickel transport system substrate-binding protein
MRTRLTHILILLSLILPACITQETQIPTLVEEPTPTLPSLLSSPTPVARTLKICLGGEPNTLYPYGNPNSPARSVLSAIYDGPIDIAEYGYEPVILEKIPSLDDGDAQVAPVTVKAGDQVVDSSGNLVALKAGDKIRPAGCRGDDCAITYDGSSQIQMDQLIVTFTMLDGLMWSDGEPLTAQDSVYSFQLASSNSTPGSKFLIDRTQTYEAASDGVTAQWWGKPGFMDSDYYTNFWMPLPQHVWGDLTADDLLTADISTTAPLGWGPYMLKEWKKGESLRFIKNLNYFRANSGLPKFDELTFIIHTDPNSAVTALVNGDCDLLDPSVQLDGLVGLLQQMQTDEQAKLITAPSNTMEWLGIGISPAAYDDGFNPNNDRPDFFGDARMRQALALCIDRQRIVDEVIFGLSQVPDTYLPADHPLHNGNVQTYTFDPAEGSKTLERIGWLDHDNNPATPRQSLGVTNVPGGTPLILNYVTSSATQRRQVAEIVTQSLAECGVGLNVTYLSASDLYAQGPNGPLFGRQFDLAEYAIGVNVIEPQCSWFTSSQIPTAKNNWVGTNISGYKNTAFDAACNRALLALPEDPSYTSHQEAQAIFAAELPSIPLYQRLKVAVARFDFCGFALDPFSLYALTGIESFDYGAGCQ